MTLFTWPIKLPRRLKTSNLSLASLVITWPKCGQLSTFSMTLPLMEKHMSWFRLPPLATPRGRLIIHLDLLVAHRIIWSPYTCRWWVDYTGWSRSPLGPLLAVPNATAHPSTASVPITVLLYNGPLFCGFTVVTKELNRPSMPYPLITIAPRSNCLLCDTIPQSFWVYTSCSSLSTFPRQIDR